MAARDILKVFRNPRLKVELQRMYFVPNLITFFTLCCMCILVETLPGASYNQEPVSLCASNEVTTKFVYGDSAVKFIDLTILTAIHWTVRKTKQDTAEIFCYYNNNEGFKIRPGPGDRFKDRVTWVPNTINLKFSDLTTNNTGLYDVLIYINGAGPREIKKANAIFQLTVNDPCLIDEGKNEKGCTMLVCSSMEDNQVYSWTGQDAEGKTDGKLTVCPGIETNYTCCVDAQKTKCSSFTAQAGEFQTTEVNIQNMDNKIPPAESTTITPEMSTTTTTPKTTEIVTTITTTKTKEKLTTFSPSETTVSTEKNCRMNQLGKNYTGTINKTRFGQKCQAWISLVPHKHHFTVKLADDKDYCRNPDTEPYGPWCYTTDPGTRWEYCDVPYCDYCPGETLESIKWWKTAAGETDIKDCPPNYTGNASRQCDNNGNWRTPVHINCVNEILHKTIEKLKQLEIITNPEQATAAIADILDTVDNTTGDHNDKPLKSGDLKHTTSILSSIIQIGNSKNASVNSEKFADVLNSVLNTGNNHSWDEVNTNDDSDKGASSIMQIVDSLGSLVQKNLSSNEKKIISRKNLVIEISTLKKNLSFPPDEHSRSRLFLADQPALKDKFYTAAMYKTLSGILPTTTNRSVGSDVMSVSFDQTIHNLAENISITFEQNEKVKFIDPKISCGYWNFSSRSWTYDGCYLKMSDSKVSTCTCNHLTNFAILMSPSDVEISDANKKALEIITFVGCGLSILGCFLTLIIYAVLWRFVKHEWAVILMHMCIVLIIGYSVFLSATEETENDIACIIITGVLHYVFLVVFFLMLCNGIIVARSVIYVFKTKSRLPQYIAVAWVVPLLIVGITLGITRLKGYHSEKYCWLNTSNFVFMSFVGPALLIILMNIGTIIIVLRAVYSRKGIQNETLKKKARHGIKCMVTLLPVLGLSWLFGILAFNEDTIIFQYLFGITTSCQGLFVFIFHTVLSKKVQEGFRKIMQRRRAKSMSNFSSKPKSSGTNDRFDSKEWRRVVNPEAVTGVLFWDSNTDSTILKDMKKETPKKYEIRASLS